MTIEVTAVRPEPTTPPHKESDEAAPHQHRMAQAQGDTYVTALKHMAETVADVGAEAAAGDMIVAIAIEEAEGMWHREDDRLVWKEPEHASHHLEVSVRDGIDNRFIPGLIVDVRVLDSGGGQIFSGRLPQLWHPWLYHYGSNFDVPVSGPHTVEVAIASPDFPRHDRENGQRFADDVFVRFENVEV